MKFFLCLLALTISGANAGFLHINKNYNLGSFGGYGSSYGGGYRSGYGGAYGGHSTRVVKVIHEQPIIHQVPIVHQVQPIVHQVQPIVHHVEPVQVVNVIGGGGYTGGFGSSYGGGLSYSHGFTAPVFKVVKVHNIPSSGGWRQKK